MPNSPVHLDFSSVKTDSIPNAISCWISANLAVIPEARFAVVRACRALESSKPGSPVLTLWIERECMKLSEDDAVIAAEKLIDYILSSNHPEGRSKAAYLSQMGYNQGNWQVLEQDLRKQHLSCDAKEGSLSPYGKKYEILAPLTGPNGKTMWIRSIWIVRHGENMARLITIIPEEKQ